MEKRVIQKVKDHNTALKHTIVQNISDLKARYENGEVINSDDFDSLIRKVYESTNIEFTDSDFTKRSRTKNTVPIEERCSALRANEDRCTRRRKNGIDFCGTHEKGQPHGVVQDETASGTTYDKKEVWAQDFGGIIYYIDMNNNVYKTEDVMNNELDPTIIARWRLFGSERRIDWGAA